MRYRSYNKETKLAVAAMLSIFNNIVIQRTDPVGNIVKKITVPCRYASESKIVKSIRNKDKALQLPIIAISRTSQERDMDRVCDIQKSFFVQGPIYNATQISDPRLTEKQKEAMYYSYDFRRNMPQPINIGFTVKIWAAYEEDLNQILGNFIPFFNPYVSISSRHPYVKTEIIRNKVIWDGTIDNELPEELDTENPDEWKASVNFTYQTWFWFGIDKGNYSETTGIIEKVVNGAAGPAGNINNGDSPSNTQWVDSDGYIWEGRDTGKNINDGDEVGENEFVDPNTGKIYYKDELHIYGNLKDGFYIAYPGQTIKRLTELIDKATKHSELPYHEHAIEYTIPKKEEADKISDIPEINRLDS